MKEKVIRFIQAEPGTFLVSLDDIENQYYKSSRVLALEIIYYETGRDVSSEYTDEYRVRALTLSGIINIEQDDGSGRLLPMNGVLYSTGQIEFDLGNTFSSLSELNLYCKKHIK